MEGSLLAQGLDSKGPVCDFQAQLWCLLSLHSEGARLCWQWQLSLCGKPKLVIGAWAGDLSWVFYSLAIFSISYLSCCNFVGEVTEPLECEMMSLRFSLSLPTSHDPHCHDFLGSTSAAEGVCDHSYWFCLCSSLTVACFGTLSKSRFPICKVGMSRAPVQRLVDNKRRVLRAGLGTGETAQTASAVEEADFGC